VTAAAAARGSFRIGATVALLTLLGIAFPVLFTAAVVLAGFAVVYVSGQFAWIAMKFLWLLVFPLLGSLRVLFVRPHYVEGQPIVASQAPELFALIERLRAAADAGPVDAVYLTDEVNAGIVQLPRYGLFGGTRNHLRLGLPLMIAMDDAHFTALLAHEIGHLARRHGSFAARIYAMRATLEVMCGTLEERHSPLAYPVRLFYRLFVPGFDRATLALSRAVELEADAAAAAAVGSTIAAEMLVVFHGITWYLNAAVWPEIMRGVASEPEPPEDVYAVVAERFRTPLADGAAFVRAALDERTAETDTHPALIDRLRSLGFEPATMESLLDGYAVHDRSAADAFLAGATAQRRALAYEWRSSVRARWDHEHTALVRTRARLAELDELGDAAEPAQLRERALAAAELRRAGATSLLTAASDALPHDGALALRAGLALLHERDERAVTYAERAIAAEPTLTPGALYVAQTSYADRNDAARAAECGARLERWKKSSAAAEEERASFTGAEPVEPHGLGDEELATVRRALDLPDLAEAYLARRTLVHMREVPHFVLAVLRKKTKWATSDRNIAQIVADELQSFPYGVSVTVTTKSHDAVVAALRAVEGTELRL
jgi:Zn-dependent protease with chaperone function